MALFKSILRVLGWMLLNLALVLTGIVWYHLLYLPIRDRLIIGNARFPHSTFYYYTIAFYAVFFPLIILWLIKKPKRLNWGIPAAFLVWYMFFTGFLMLNEKLEIETETKRAACLYCHHMDWIVDDVLRVSLDEKADVVLSVSSPNFIAVDSVEVNIAKSIFGLKSLKNEFSITPQKNCRLSEVDSLSADVLMYKRCFTEAKRKYMIQLETCSNCSSIHFNLGTIYFLEQNYAQADKSFLQAIKSLLEKHFLLVDDISIERTKKILEHYENNKSMREYFESYNPLEYILLKGYIDLRKKSLQGE